MMLKNNQFCVGYTSNGVAFFFDCEDSELIQRHNWMLSKRGYITCKIKRKNVCLHKLLIKCDSSFDIDHISGNKLDNRKSNLRVCTHQENLFNQRIRSTNKTGFAGVAWHDGAKKYEAYVHCAGKKHYLGLFHNAEDAAIARDSKARELYGEFANPNFPDATSGGLFHGFSI